MSAPRWFPWAVVGGGAAILLLKNKTEQDVPVPQQDLDKLMVDAYADAAFNTLINDLAKATQQSAPTVKQRFTGPMEVVMDFEVSWIEKALASKKTVAKDARTAGIAIAKKLASECPGAPLLSQTNPTVVKLINIDGGFRARMVWPAVWRGPELGPVRAQVRDCIEALLKKVKPKTGERLIRLTVARI